MLQTPGKGLVVSASPKESPPPAPQAWRYTNFFLRIEVGGGWVYFYIIFILICPVISVRFLVRLPHLG